MSNPEWSMDKYWVHARLETLHDRWVELRDEMDVALDALTYLVSVVKGDKEEGSKTWGALHEYERRLTFKEDSDAPLEVERLKRKCDVVAPCYAPHEKDDTKVFEFKGYLQHVSISSHSMFGGSPDKSLMEVSFRFPDTPRNYAVAFMNAMKTEHPKSLVVTIEDVEDDDD